MGSLSPVQDGIKQVTRKELYTDFSKRMDFLRLFLDLTDDDIIVFNKGAKFLKAALPVLTHRLYAKMLDFDITARALRVRSTESDAQVDEYFTLDGPHVQRRKIFWKWYLTRLFSDPSRLEYWEYLDKVGKMHTGKILMHPLKIEYMHMNTCLGYVKELAYETISGHPEMSYPFKFTLIRAFNKIMTIQNDLISRCYIREGQEFDHHSPSPGEAPTTGGAPPHTDTGSNTDSCVSDTRSTADTRSSTDSRSIPDPQSYADIQPNPDARSLPETRPNTGGGPTAETGSIAESRSNADTYSIPDSTANSETSSMANERQLHPRCLVPGLSQSRPTSSKGSVPSLRDRSASFDLSRVRTASDSISSYDPPSTAGSSQRLGPSYAGTATGFTSPFTVDQLGQSFETKIWSAKPKQKWFKASE
ncbi:uncharacterized protein BO87DRAFT_424821 [Aspergillus neoniger CBS 115656]|uniref:Globin-sensor domain-containing protein n=1 Tax=Aspergillus neoniger (strain CBS 115656) TaxID=1448310 RepID=A0A318Z570_ASPNB|nr:hypothetical protein BO87DRAFT_424821 [Aspergillus neoniger CBS 115656]PYH35318.1 hypothetical protein BO87DRAFT_424821 [Aspergillus neoniger CBS 115656]